MGEPELSQLCRLRSHAFIPQRPGPTDRAGPGATVRDDVFGGRLVALPSAYRCGSSHRSWREGLSPDGRQQSRTGEADQRRARPGERGGDLPGRKFQQRTRAPSLPLKTVRKTFDSIIATWCIEGAMPRTPDNQIFTGNRKVCCWRFGRINASVASYLEVRNSLSA